MKRKKFTEDNKKVKHFNVSRLALILSFILSLSLLNVSQTQAFAEDNSKITSPPEELIRACHLENFTHLGTKACLRMLEVNHPPRESIEACGGIYFKDHEITCIETLKVSSPPSRELIEACSQWDNYNNFTNLGIRACLEMLKTTHPSVKSIRACRDIYFEDHETLCIETLKVSSPPSRKLIEACSEPGEYDSFTNLAIRACLEMLKTTHPPVQSIWTCRELDSEDSEILCIELLKASSPPSWELIDVCGHNNFSGLAVKTCLEMLKTFHPPRESIRACSFLYLKAHEILCIEMLKTSSPPSEELIDACGDLGGFSGLAIETCLEMLKTTRPPVESIKACSYKKNEDDEINCLKSLKEQT